jgi:hypothetical protein
MSLRLMAFAILSAVASPACGATCDQSVVAGGNLLSGQNFSTQLRVPGLGVEGAFQQLGGILQKAGLQVRLDDRARGLMRAEAGAKLMEPARAIDILFSRDRDTGVIQMTQSYRPGILAIKGLARSQICAMLGAVRPPNRALALPSRGAIPIGSIQLATRVLQVRDNPARLRTEFANRFFRVSGRVIKIAEARGGFSVAFEADAEAAKNEGAWPRIALTCQIDQAQTAATLTPNQPATLIGRFARFDDYRATPTVLLEDCRAP